MKQLSLKALALALAAFVMMSTDVNAQASAMPDEGVDVQSVAKNNELSKYLGTKRQKGVEAGQIAAKPSGDVRKSGVRKIKPGSAPRGTFYGNVARSNSIQFTSQYFMGEIEGATGKIKQLFFNPNLCDVGTDYDVAGGTIADGVYYALGLPTMSNGVSGIAWNRFDMRTYQMLDPVDFGNDWGGYAYTMAYDPNTKIFHVISFNSNTGSSTFVPAYYQVNLSNYEYGTKCVPSYVTDITLPGGAFACALVYNPADRNLYLFDSNNAVYTLDRRNGKVNKCAQLEMNYRPFTEYMATAVCYSPLDRAFMVYYRDTANKCMRLLFIDADTFEFIEGPVVTGGGGNPYLASVACMDPYAEQDAPAQPAEVAFNLVKDSHTGSVTFTVPTDYYKGEPLPTDAKVATVYTIDGVEYFNGECAPGESKTIDFTLDEGVHKSVVACKLGSLESPARETAFYVGNDNPKAPENIKVAGNVITWKAPGDKGQHDGYVDVADLTYNVYFDGVKLNTEPISGTSYTFAVPADLLKRVVGVEAVAHNKASLHNEVKAIIGEPLRPDYNLVPTKEEAETFTILNGYADDVHFEYRSAEAGQGIPSFWLNAGYVVSNMNEWLILPITKLEDASKTYGLTYSFRSPIESSSAAQNVKVYIGKEPTHQAMTREIYSAQGVTSRNFKKVEIPFGVEEPGDYYIGINVKTNGATGGIVLNDFSVVVKGSADIPSDPSVEIVAAPKGLLKATVNVTMPTQNLAFQPLDPESEVTVKVSVGDNSITVQGKPGETVSKDIEVDRSGTASFAVLPWNENGVGVERVYYKYVGLDTPGIPQNAKVEIAEDNLSMTLTWDPVGEVGAHGGYVDLENVHYRVMMRESVAEYVLADTDKLEYVIYPDEPGRQDFTEVAVCAVGVVNNREVQGETSRYMRELLGRTYELPLYETFNTNGFAFSPWTFETEGVSTDAMWDNTDRFYDAVYQNPKMTDGGCLYCYNQTDEGTLAIAELRVPKVTTMGAKNVAFMVRYWDYPLAPTMHVYARTKENMRVFIGDITPRCPIKGEWVEASLPIPDELLDKGWVQFLLDCDLTGSYEQYGIIDTLTVGQNIEYDFKVTDLTGPEETMIGDKPQFSVNVANAGTESLQGKLILELRDEHDKVLESEELTVRRMSPMQRFEKVFEYEMKAEYKGLKKLKVVARIESASDMISINNSKEFTFKLNDSSLPVITDLFGQWSLDGTSSYLTWSEPELYHGDREDFEAYKPFQITDKIGSWKNLDLDGREPALIAGLRWDGDEKPQAWHVFNAEELGVMTDPRLAPHSGTQYLMARCAMQVSDDDQTADWLISPEIVGGSQLSFWVNTISVDYTEYMVLYYSTTDDKPESFIKYKPISKWGNAAWEKATYTLPKDAKYIALAYVSFDCFGIMLDDICITPKQLDKWIVDSYSVYRYDNGDPTTYRCIAPAIYREWYLDPTDNKDVSYNVVANVKVDGKIAAGAKSNTVHMATAGVNGIEQLTGVTAGKGVVNAKGYAGKQLALYDTTGKFVKLANLASDNEQVQAEAGVYIVKIDNAYTKVMVR